MKQWCFLFLLCPALAMAQRIEWDIAYTKMIPDSLTRPIHMPPRDYNPHLRYDTGVTPGYEVKKRIVVIQSDSMYRQFFWRYTYTNDSLKACKAAGCDHWWYNWMEKHHVDSLPLIDFSKNELVLYAACAQCLAFCHHAAEQGSCHRNACSFRETWFIREKRIKISK
jgi:hypothetical protein